jgi:deaminated glutathione amidase
MKVAAIQMTSSVLVEKNLATAARLLARAAASGAKLAVLPENFAIMSRTEQDKRATAEADGVGPIQSFLSQQAKLNGLTIVAGTIPLLLDHDPRVAAASLVYGPDGTRLGRYDKIHLFDVDVPATGERHRESEGLAPGRNPCVLDTPAGRIGVVVCYDLRFPELFRRMMEQGAEYFVISAAFTVPTGEAHWDLLLRTRAVENLSHLVASAQWGEHENGRRTYGNSLIVDCWGAVLDRLPTGEGIAVATLDLARQAQIRREFPALEHRVFDRH